MFGYVTINPAELPQEEQRRYQAYYCGLCKTLKKRHGNPSRLTLSYDLTFLFILLSSLYEPEEHAFDARCLPHPIQKRPHIQNALADYAADMNVLLSYHKLRDNWQDDRSLKARLGMASLGRAYRRVQKRYPEKCARIEESLREIGKLEAADDDRVDGPANWTARMLGEIYDYQDDLWAPVLRRMGEALGRFIYMMDAYEDLPEDVAKHRYNPLQVLRAQEDYEIRCRDILSILIAECTDAFELLPLVQDIELMRNILYSGVWTRYAAIQAQNQSKESKT